MDSLLLAAMAVGIVLLMSLYGALMAWLRPAPVTIRDIRKGARK